MLGPKSGVPQRGFGTTQRTKRLQEFSLHGPGSSARSSLKFRNFSTKRQQYPYHIPIIVWVLGMIGIRRQAPENMVLGSRITLEHSLKHHFGTQPFSHHFGTQNPTCHQTTANQKDIRFIDRHSTLEASRVPKRGYDQKKAPNEKCSR